MIQCQNCGQTNSAESQFCRFCGTKFLQRQTAVHQSYEVQPPRAYSWKTDEFQTKTDARKTATLDQQNTQNHLQFPPYQAAASSAMVDRGVQFMDPNYRCPHCRSQFLPKTERRISTAGWITFAVLLVTIFPLFWIGLLIKEDVYVCPSCSTRLGR
ncbi:MAG: LITAF-like zinc ribbon domain-containing protein [Pyrinomonadaceae bacterium]